MKEKPLLGFTIYDFFSLLCFFCSCLFALFIFWRIFFDNKLVFDLFFYSYILYIILIYLCIGCKKKEEKILTWIEEVNNILCVCMFVKCKERIKKMNEWMKNEFHSIRLSISSMSMFNIDVNVFFLFFCWCMFFFSLRFSQSIVNEKWKTIQMIETKKMKKIGSDWIKKNIGQNRKMKWNEIQHQPSVCVWVYRANWKLYIFFFFFFEKTDLHL